MPSQPIYIFKPEDYQGELNLNAMERRVIIRELKRTQRILQAVELLGFSERSLNRKMKAHQIKKEEWKNN